MKQTFFKLINALPGQNIMPPKTHRLPEGWTWRQLQDAVMEKHRPIRQYLRSGIGLELQRIDSDIAEVVMLNMMVRHDLPVLPIHDSFLCYIGSVNRLRDVMRDAFLDSMRRDIGIDPDPSFVEIVTDEDSEFGEPLDPATLVEWQESQPGYEGYRRRRREFFSSRTADWHRRFGGHCIG